MSTAQTGQDWSRYWQEGDTERALPEDNPGTRALAAFWAEYAAALAARRPQARILDLGCGGGFALRQLAAQAEQGSVNWAMIGLDLALPALQQLPRPAGCTLWRLQGDAAQPPFATGSMDLVLSQFGLEYAGSAALQQAAQLLAPGGELMLLVHHREGAIAHSCAASHAVVDGLIQCGVLAAMRHWFELRAQHPRNTQRLGRAVQQLRAPIRDLETLLRTAPESPAKQLGARLHTDLSRLYNRADAFAPAEVLNWLDGMDAELAAYRGRMQGMLEAAQSAQGVDALLAHWRAEGLDSVAAEVLVVNEHPLAWQLSAQCPPGQALHPV